jgi:hypothetical protein
VDVHCRLAVTKALDAIKSEPDPNGRTSYYYRRLNRYDARITVDGRTSVVSGDAINEHVLLR